RRRTRRASSAASRRPRSRRPRRSAAVSARAAAAASRSRVRPAAHEVVIDAGEPLELRRARILRRELLDRGVELEQQRALRVLADEALDPEKRRETYAACHGRDAVQARCGIEN